MNPTKELSTDEDLFTQLPKGRKTSKAVEDDMEIGERISFKIGRTKVPEECDPVNSSGCSSSTASTVPAEASQRDMFASQETSSSQLPNSGASGDSANTTSSLESFTGVARTSTPRKRKPDNADTNSNSKLQRIAEEHMNENGSQEHGSSVKRPEFVNMSFPDSQMSPTVTRKGSPVTYSARAKRRPAIESSPAKRELFLDSQLPDTVAIESPDVELVSMHPKSRQSLEVVYVGQRSSTRISRPNSQEARLSKNSAQEVFNIEDDEDDSLHLYLSQSQSQTQNIGSQETKTPVAVKGKESFKQLNGNSGEEDVVPDSPRKNMSMKLGLEKKNIVLVGEDDSPNHMTSSYSTFAKVRDISEKKAPVISLDGTGAGFVTPEAKVIPEESLHTATFTFVWKCIKNSATNEVISRERIQCCEVKDETVPRVLSHLDISPGALADISGQSKNASPSSITSTGLFALPAVSNIRCSIVSTVSSSSSSSITSAASLHAKSVDKADHLLTLNRSLLTHHNQVKLNGCELPRKHVTIPEEDLLRIESRIDKLSADRVHFVSPKNGSSLRGLRKPTKKAEEVTGVTELPVLTSTPVDDVPVDQNSTLSSMDGTPSTIKADSTPSMIKVDSPAASAPRSKTSGRKAKSVSVKKATPLHGEIETPKSSTKKSEAPVRGRSRQKRGAKSKCDTVSSMIESVIDEAVEPKLPGKRRKAVATPPPNVNQPPRRKLVATPPITPTPAQDHSPAPMAAFARWTDRRYYSATVLGIARDGRCSVKFDDGTTKTLPEDNVIRVRELHKNLSVYAKVNSRDFESGFIISFKVEDGVVLYVVDLDSGKSVTVPRSALNMTEDQAEVLKDFVKESTACASTTTPKHSRAANAINMDNIVYRKRNRKGNDQDLLPANVAEPVTPRSDVSDAVNMSSDDISGVDMEYFPLAYPSLNAEGLSKVAARVKGRGNTGAPKKTNDEEITTLLGPIPPAGSKMFAGMSFLFTCNGRTVSNSGNESMCESNPSENESSHLFYQTPFVKERLITQIMSGGGTVFKRFDDLIEAKNNECYLLANGPCQTANYILCLANMIPTVTHNYIILCSKQNKRLPIQNHYLPAGYSVDKERFIPANERNSRRPPLRNMNVVVASDADSFVTFWSKVLTSAGARVNALSSDTEEKPSADEVDVIIADHTFTAKMMAWAIDVGIAVVSSDWAKQCVICWEKCNVRGKSYQFSRLYSS